LENENIEKAETAENRVSGNSEPARAIPCEYAERCFRKNPIHKMERCHPGDANWWDPLTEIVSNDPRPGKNF